MFVLCCKLINLHFLLFIYKGYARQGFGHNLLHYLYHYIFVIIVLFYVVCCRLLFALLFVISLLFYFKRGTMSQNQFWKERKNFLISVAELN